MRGNQTEQDMTIISKPAARPKIGTEETTNEDTSIQEEQGREDYKNQQPDSLERKLEEMATPIATAGLQPRKEQAARKKRSRTIETNPMEASRRTTKNQCARIETTEEDKTCQPRQKTKKTDEIRRKTNALDANTPHGET